jgi:hypothetical protein
MKNFKTIKEALEYMIENPRSRGIMFHTTQYKAIYNGYYTFMLFFLQPENRHQNPLYTIEKRTILLRNCSSLQFEGLGKAKWWADDFDFTVGKIPAKVLEVRPDLKED